MEIGVLELGWWQVDLKSKTRFQYLYCAMASPCEIIHFACLFREALFKNNVLTLIEDLARCYTEVARS